jgi:hypothetical protein
MNENYLFFMVMTGYNSQFDKTLKLSKGENYHENQLAKINYKIILLVAGRNFI